MKILSVFLCMVLLLVSCMSEREYQLRNQQLKNQAAHPATFDVLSVEGPVKIEILEGGIARVTAPNQPFKEIPIPDGVSSEVELAKHLISTGAIVFIGNKALNKAGRTKTTVIQGGE